MNIALYGGSFDPPHIGHVNVVTTALAVLDIGKLIVVPTFVNPFKLGTHASAKQRLAWLQKVFEKEVHVEVSDFEVLQNRAVPSIDTVTHFAKVYARIYFIIGADNLASLRKWHRFKALDERVTWVVATRHDIAIPKEYIQLHVDHAISSSELRVQLQDAQLPPVVAASIKTYYEENHAR